MKTILLNTLLIGLTVLSACQDRKNIIVTGQIVDETTGKPITNAEVVVLCWYMHNIDDASFNKQTLLTDSNGNYKASFDKGHKIDVASKAKYYEPKRIYNKLRDNKIDVPLRLTKKRNNRTLLTLLNTDMLMSDINEDFPFMRVRVYGDKNGTNLDFNNVETYGFDFKTLKTTTNTLESDLWFNTIEKEGQPTTITTNSTGGIIPIFEFDVKSSLLFEKNVAPTKGYKQTHNLTGDEAGFFVLCRDGKTYGKIILEKPLIDISCPDGNGSYYKEFGRNFSCVYQTNGTTDLTYSNTDIDLEDFLVDFRYQ